MKNIKNLLLILITALFFTACEKEETPNFDTISGILSPGENVGVEDLSEITLYLAKLHDGIDPLLVTTDTEELDLVKEVALNADGTFAFTQLELGNYVIALSGNYMISTDTFLVASINGIQIEAFQKTIKRKEEENGLIGVSIDQMWGGDNGSDNTSESPYNLIVTNSCVSEYGDIQLDFYENSTKRYQLIAPPAHFEQLFDQSFRIEGQWNGTLNFESESTKTVTLVWGGQSSDSFDLPKERGTLSKSDKLNQNGLKVKVKVKWGFTNDKPEIIIGPY